MKRKEQYADEIIEMLERTKCGAWASNINLNTKDRVIEVCQNCVDSWSGRKFKDHCTTPPQALEQTSWIPIKWHNITEDEREQKGYPKEWLTMFDCPMPYDEQEILITVQGSKKRRYVEKDICYVDDGYGLDSGYDWIDDVVAWMPLPPCYEPQESEE